MGLCSCSDFIQDGGFKRCENDTIKLSAREQNGLVRLLEAVSLFLKFLFKYGFGSVKSLVLSRF